VGTAFTEGFELDGDEALGDDDDDVEDEPEKDLNGKRRLLRRLFLVVDGTGVVSIVGVVEDEGFDAEIFDDVVVRGVELDEADTTELLRSLSSCCSVKEIKYSAVHCSISSSSSVDLRP
jgi:hypothetical protein